MIPTHSKQCLDVQRSIPGTDEIICQRLDDQYGLTLLNRSPVHSNQDRLLCLDEGTPVSLISPTPRRRSSDCHMGV